MRFRETATREVVIGARITGVQKIEALLAGYKNPVLALRRSLAEGIKKQQSGEKLTKAIRRTGIFKKIKGIRLYYWMRQKA